MNRTILTAVVCLCLSVNAFAQQTDTKKTPQQKAQHATDELSKKLSLTADQKSKIYAINLESSTKAKEGRKAAKDQKISAILNDTQRKTYAEIRAKKEAKKLKKEVKKGEKKKA